MNIVADVMCSSALAIIAAFEWPFIIFCPDFNPVPQWSDSALTYLSQSIFTLYFDAHAIQNLGKSQYNEGQDLSKFQKQD